MRTRGYNSCTSWVAAFACSILGFLIPLPMRVAGLIFIIIIDRYETTRMYATIPIMVFGIIRAILGPFVGYLGEKFGLRSVTLTGCLLASIGIGACFFAEDVIAVTFFLGFIYGIGFGLANTLVPEILKQHFSENLNLVNGMFLAGSCLGALTMPPLIQFFAEKYGDSGMFLLLAGIMLHSVPFAIFLKDPKNKEHYAEIKNLKIRDNRITKSLEKMQTEESVAFLSKLNGTNKTVEVSDMPKHYKCANENDDSVNSELIIQPSAKKDKIFDQVQIIKKSLSNDEDLNTYSKSLDLYNNRRSSSCNVLSNNCVQVVELSNYNRKYSLPNKISDDDSKLEMNKNKHQIEIRPTFPEDSETPEANKGETRHKLVLIFLDSTFHLTMIIQSLQAFIMTLNWTILIDYSRDKGISPSDSIYFLMFLPLSEIIGSLTLNWISDHGFMTRTKYCVVCHLILSGIPVCIIFAHSYALMMTAVLIFGVVSGSLVATFPGMVYEFIEEELQGLALASRFVLYAFLCITKSPITGYFRETLGSYDWVYFIIAMCSVLCAILTVFTPVSAARRRKKAKGDIAMKF